MEYILITSRGHSVKRGIVIVHVRLFVTSRDAQRKARYSDRAHPSVCYLAWA